MSKFLLWLGKRFGEAIYELCYVFIALINFVFVKWFGEYFGISDTGAIIIWICMLYGSIKTSLQDNE